MDTSGTHVKPRSTNKPAAWICLRRNGDMIFLQRINSMRLLGPKVRGYSSKGLDRIKFRPKQIADCPTTTKVTVSQVLPIWT